MARRTEMTHKSRTVTMSTRVPHCFIPQKASGWQWGLSITSAEVSLAEHTPRMWHCCWLLWKLDLHWKQLFPVSCMLCATQPAFLLRYAERLTHTVASGCARFYSRRQQSQLPPSQPDPSWTTNGKPKLSSEDVLCRLILSKQWMGIQGYRWANTVENINKIEWKWIWCRVCVLES